MPFNTINPGAGSGSGGSGTGGGSASQITNDSNVPGANVAAALNELNSRTEFDASAVVSVTVGTGGDYATWADFMTWQLNKRGPVLNVQLVGGDPIEVAQPGLLNVDLSNWGVVNLDMNGQTLTTPNMAVRLIGRAPGALCFMGVGNFTSAIWEFLNCGVVYDILNVTAESPTFNIPTTSITGEEGFRFRNLVAESTASFTITINGGVRNIFINSDIEAINNSSAIYSSGSINKLRIIGCTIDQVWTDNGIDVYGASSGIGSVILMGNTDAIISGGSLNGIVSVGYIAAQGSTASTLADINSGSMAIIGNFSDVGIADITAPGGGAVQDDRAAGGSLKIW